MYYKVNEKEGKTVKHIYNLYTRGYYYEEIAIIFSKGDIIYGIHERIKYILSIIEEIIYKMPRKKRKKGFNFSIRNNN